ncbi:MAG: hypothetical protein JNG85_14615, partial [Spirochaetaceae bacterium]|nr:hypothetical protein [Spirochaetaceae bacterium]
SRAYAGRNLSSVAAVLTPEEKAEKAAAREARRIARKEAKARAQIVEIPEGYCTIDEAIKSSSRARSILLEAVRLGVIRSVESGRRRFLLESDVQAFSRATKGRARRKAA